MGLARAARYPASVIKEVSPERLKRFFVHEAGAHRVVKELRDICVFSTHSVIRDPLFSRLDLISCRNLLIYLKPSLQSQIIPLFHYSLRLGGFLFLGSSENVSRHSELFAALDRKNRVFRRRDLVARSPLPLRQFQPQSWRPEGAVPGENQSGLVQRTDMVRRIAGTIVEQFAPTFVIVDETGQTLYFSGPGNICNLPRDRPIAMLSDGPPRLAHRPAGGTQSGERNGTARRARPRRRADKRPDSGDQRRNRAGP
jgi:two-component system, chemotaxis family, CheB/CheR fusion protein